MSELATRELPTRGPGRALGLRAKPALRLALGYRDEAKGGAPTKTDHFIPKRGAKGEHDRAADKFQAVYGERPRAIRILLPSSLGQALTIQHKAWGSAGDDEGGVLKAIGRTNFALEGTLGGPDVLTVWNPDGTVDELEISGVDDPEAQALGVDLYTTFRFALPDVLGIGAFAEVTSKGQETTDNLWLKLRELYGAFGARVPFVVQPQLVLRPASGRPLVQTKDGPKRIRSSFFALDLYMPESFDQMFERLRERAALLPDGSAQTALYGPETRALGPASHPDKDEAAAVDDAADAGDQAPADRAAAVAGAPPADGPTFAPPDDDPAALELEREGQAAGLMTFTHGRYSGLTLGEVLEQKGEDGERYLRWAALRWETEPLRSALRVFCRVYLPDSEVKP